MTTAWDKESAKGESNRGDNRRAHPRLPFSASQILATVAHPGGTVSELVVACRNLSGGGVAILHRGFLYAGTACEILLPLMTGGKKAVTGRVVRCDHCESNLHEVGIALDQSIDPREFLDVGVDCPELNDKPMLMPDLRGRVLHLGTDTLDFALFQHQTEGTSLETRSCREPDEAPALLRKTVHDVVFCDLPLEGANAIEVLRALRNSGYRGPIIVASAERNLCRLQRYKKAGADDVLLKPFSPTALLRVLSQSVGTVTHLTCSNEPIRSTLPTDSALMPLVAEFVYTAQSTAAALREAAETENLERLRELCLRLQGKGASFGFKVLTEVAAEAVDALNTATCVADVGRHLERLQNLCARLQEERAA